MAISESGENGGSDGFGGDVQLGIVSVTVKKYTMVEDNVP